MIKPTPQVAAMQPYALADLDSDAFSLAQNESFLPPSPAAVAAFAEASATQAFYPDPDWTALRDALAAHYPVQPSQLLCGAGSMELIGAVIRAFSGPGDSVVASQYSYAFVATACKQAGSHLVHAPESQHTVDIDALLGRVDADTRIVFVANPGNPTGTVLAADDLLRLRTSLPQDVLLMVDQAYGEFADDDADSVWSLIERGDTVITRSFSKAYALAGARVGWCALAPSLGEQVRKLLNPNNVSRASQAAATAALQDRSHLQQLVQTTTENRAQLSNALRAQGYAVQNSHTNFVLVPFRDQSTCEAANAELRQQGLIGRTMGGYGLGHCLRITVADPDTMVHIAEQLAPFSA